MKSVVYTGSCKSVTVRGRKFTESVRVHVIPDEDAIYFLPPSFILNDVVLDPRSEASKKLTELVIRAQALDPADYTQEAWDVLEDKISVAQACIDEKDSLVEDFESSFDELTTAIEGLEEGSAYVEPIDDGVDYNEYSAKELKELCSERGIAFAGNASKTKLIKLLHDYDQEMLDSAGDNLEGDSEGGE